MHLPTSMYKLPLVMRRAVANYLKRARIAAGFKTQTDFAKAAGVTQQQISNYEKSGRVPQENVARIARALKIPVDELAMMLVEAAEEDERATRRENNTLKQDVERILESAERQSTRFQRFADKYEELGHSYAANHELLAKLVQQNEVLIRRLDELEANLQLHRQDPPPERPQRRNA